MFTTTYTNGKLNCLVFRDSFFIYLAPYFSHNFKQATYVWDMLSYDNLNQYLDIAKPDVVIEEWVERTLPYVPKDRELFEKD